MHVHTHTYTNRHAHVGISPIEQVVSAPLDDHTTLLSTGVPPLSQGPYLPDLSLHHGVKVSKSWAEMLPRTNRDRKSVLFI